MNTKKLKYNHSKMNTKKLKYNHSKMNTKKLKYITFVILIITQFQSASQEIKDTSWKEIDNLFSALDNANSPGVSIAISWNHEPVYIKSYGMADIENKVKVTKETAFNLASLTKQFTAYATLLLAEQGKLSLEDPITKYLPELSFDKVSIRQLMNQTSGIPSERIASYGSFPRGGKDQLLKLYGAQTLASQPGTRWVYNNNNYNLLSIIVERVSGKPLPLFLSDEVFSPLEMKQSYFPFGPGATKENRAYGYMKRNNKFVNVDRNDVFLNLVGAGGMYSSISDLIKWDKALYNKNYAAKERQVDGKYLSGENVSYGAGVNVSNQGDVFSIEHGGTSGATSTYIAHYPKYGASIIILIASNYYHSSNGAKKLTHQIKQELFKRFNNTLKPKRPKKNWAAWSLEELKKVEGLWFGELNGTLQQIDIEVSDSGSMILKFFDGFSIALHQVGKETFRSKIMSEILVRINSNGISFLDEKKVLGFVQKITNDNPHFSPENLIGNYTASALNHAVWEFSIRDKKLVVTRPSGRTMTLEPIFGKIVGNTKANIYFEQVNISNGKKTWVLMAGQIPKIQLHKTKVKQAVPLISKALELSGSKAAWRQFKAMRKQSKKFDFVESAFNSLGYSLLRKKHPIEALVVFQMMVEVFPSSLNALDSLADGFLANERIAEAKKTYQAILNLDPNQSNARLMLNKLEKGAN